MSLKLSCDGFQKRFFAADPYHDFLIVEGQMVVSRFPPLFLRSIQIEEEFVEACCAAAGDQGFIKNTTNEGVDLQIHVNGQAKNPCLPSLREATRRTYGALIWLTHLSGFPQYNEEEGTTEAEVEEESDVKYDVDDPATARKKMASV